MKKKITIAGILLGTMNFLYLYFLFTLVLFIFYKTSIFSSQIKLLNIFIIAGCFLFFLGYSIIKINKISKKFNRFIKINTSNKIFELFEFLLFSVIISVLFYLIFKIELSNNYLLESSVFVLIFLIAGSIAFDRIFYFFSNIILYNFFYSYYTLHYADENKIYRIYDYEDFLERARELINQTQRFKLNMGFIILYFSNLDNNKSFQYQKFLRKQINFLLIENSRNYEHWGRSRDKNIYIKILEVSDKDALLEACERFFSLMKQHQFFVLNKSVEVNFKMLGVYLKQSYFDSNEISMMDEFLLILKQDFELVRRMEEDLKVIELE